MSLDSTLINLAAKFVSESNLIEGVDTIQSNVASRLRANTYVGHVGALLYIDWLATRNKIYIHKQDICCCQKLIIAEQNKTRKHKFIAAKELGHYRPLGINVVIAGRLGTCPEKIEKAMSRLLNDVRQFLKEQGVISVRGDQEIQDVVKKIARFHYRFEQIHPFIDGNGRVGRLLIWYLFRFLDLTPFIFTDHDKRYTYYQCFDDPKEMEKYFLRRYKM